jgi:leader peptidase (prepilin peptidase)/N-methyltransferase
MIAAMILLYGLLFLMGASIFSFLNVVIYRLPAGISFVSGRSHCPKCDATLAWYDMVPVVNWFVLRGKCRNCHAPISFRYPAVELLGGLLALACFLKYGMTAQFVTAFAWLAVLTVIGFIDFDTMEIPNGLVAALLVIGLVDVCLNARPLCLERLLGVVVVSVPMLLLALAVPGAFGGGDIKMMAATGLMLGWKLNLLATFLAIVGGGFYGIFLLASKKADRKSHFAFGPFLCIGLAVSLFVGERLLTWYLGFFV